MTISAKRRDQLVAVDALSPELRGCVHEFGYPIVHACINAGVTSPTAIRVLVKEIWGGARQQAQRNGVEGTLDWLMMQAGAGISARRLRRVLADHNMAVLSAEPTKAMIVASMNEVSGHNIRCTKEEKHRRRLRAAMRAAMREGLQ